MDNSVIENLKEVNLFRSENYYFAASSLKIPNKYILYIPFINGINIDGDDYRAYTYIINYTKDGLGVLPMYDGMMYNLASFIPLNNITKVDIKKKWGYYQLIIIIDNKKILSIRANKKDIYLKNHKNNLKIFLEDFIH